jgi:hypothetical protein
VLYVATVHGVFLAAAVLVVRWVCRGLLSSTDIWDNVWLYVLPVQTHAQSTVLVFAAVAPLFVHYSMAEVEPVSASTHTQACFFHVLVLTTALFLDALFFNTR